jgi:hypothetical protein
MAPEPTKPAINAFDRPTAPVAALLPSNPGASSVGSLPGERGPITGLVQQWHSKPRKLRIIHVGAGATGLCTAYKMRNQLQDYELVCYEKNASIGGTWLESMLACSLDHNNVLMHVLTKFGEQIDIQAVLATCNAACRSWSTCTDIVLRPAHIYTYTFRPNPNWTSYYAVCRLVRFMYV